MLHGLFELRTIVEPAAAALAAARRDQGHLDTMRRALDAMSLHTLTWSRAASPTRNFTRRCCAPPRNPYIVSLTNGVTAAVNALTEFKQRIAPLKRDPVPDHLRVYDAIAAKDAEGARAAMTELIRLAIMDTPIKQRPKHVAAVRAQRDVHH